MLDFNKILAACQDISTAGIPWTKQGRKSTLVAVVVEE